MSTYNTKNELVASSTNCTERRDAKQDTIGMKRCKVWLYSRGSVAFQPHPPTPASTSIPFLHGIILVPAAISVRAGVCAFFRETPRSSTFSPRGAENLHGFHIYNIVSTHLTHKRLLSSHGKLRILAARVGRSVK